MQARNHATRTRPVRRAMIFLLCVVASGGIMTCAGKPGEESSPAGVVRAMSLFSRDGRVNDYLDCFTGELRAKLEQTRDQAKPGEFADALRRRSAPVRGLAVSDQTQLDAETMRLKIEWVFDDRNEIQTFTLRKVQGAWKIADMTDAQYRKPDVSYGTKVDDPESP